MRAMAVDTQSRRSRRALLTAAAGAAAASVVGAVVRPLPVLAAGDDGSTIKVGSTFLDAQTGTYLSNQANNNIVFSAVSSSAGGHGNGIGLFGSSSQSLGVSGHSDTNAGVYGDSPSMGVEGYSEGTSGVGVGGFTNASIGTTYGVFGQSFSPQSAGVYGTGATGVLGYSGPANMPPAVLPLTGVYGSAPGVGGRGGVFKGRAAQVRLAPSSATTHPSSGQAGDLFVDASKRLWFCKGRHELEATGVISGLSDGDADGMDDVGAVNVQADVTA